MHNKPPEKHVHFMHGSAKVSRIWNLPFFSLNSMICLLSKFPKLILSIINILPKHAVLLILNLLLTFICNSHNTYFL